MIETDVDKRYDFTFLKNHSYFTSSPPHQSSIMGSSGRIQPATESYSIDQKKQLFLGSIGWVTKLATESALVPHKKQRQCLQLIVFLMSKKFLLLWMSEPSVDVGCVKVDLSLKLQMDNHKSDDLFSLIHKLPRHEEYINELSENLSYLNQADLLAAKMHRLTLLIRLLFLMILDRFFKKIDTDGQPSASKKTILECCTLNDLTVRGFVKEPNFKLNTEGRLSEELEKLYKAYKMINEFK